jgi:hypothetical protein
MEKQIGVNWKKKTDRVGGQLKEKKSEASLYINMNSEILLYYFTHYAASRIKKLI